MGREIRRVPPDWEHPKRQNTWGYDYAPLYDRSYEKALAEWENGEKPEPEYYRPAWPEGTATAFQVYETVSEGTPTSPVFETEEALIDWLVSDQGHSEAAAREFVRIGFVPSAMIVGGRLASNVEALEPGFLPKREE